MAQKKGDSPGRIRTARDSSPPRSSAKIGILSSALSSPPDFIEGAAYFLFLVLVTFLPMLYFRQTKSNFIFPKQLFFEPAVLFISLLWLLSSALKGRLEFVRSSLNVLAALYLGVCALSLIHAVPLFEGLIEYRACLMGGLGFVLAMNLVRTRARGWAVLAGISLAAVIQAIWGTSQFLNADKILQVKDQAIGTIGNSNYLGGLLAMFLFPLLAVTLGAWRTISSREKSYTALIAGIVLLVVVGLGLLFSKCRAAYIGGGVGLLAFGFALLAQIKVRGKTVAIILGVALLAAVTLFGISWGLSKRNPFSFAKLEPRSTSGRILMWRATWLMIHDYPVLGTGIGTYGYYYLGYLSRTFAGKDIKPILYLVQNDEKPHNAYLQIWSETGSLGLAAFLLLCALYFWDALLDLRRIERFDDRFGLLGIVCGQLAFLTTIGVSSLLVISPLREYFWIFLGLSMGWRRATGGGSDWVWRPEGWKKQAMAFMVTAVPTIALVFGAEHSWRLFKANIYWEKGVRATDGGHFQVATQWYDKAIELTPDQHKLMFYRGSILVRLSEDAYDSNGLALREAGMKDLLVAVEGYSDVNLFANLGKAYSSKGENEQSLYWYKRAAAPGLDYARSHTNVGVALLTLGRLDDAARELDEALAVEPDLGWAHFNLGLVRMKQKRYEQAADQFRAYLKTYPNSADAYNNLGLSLIEMNKVTEAIEVFKKALARNPDHIRARNNLGAAYLSLQQVELAREQWEKVLQVDPNNIIARKNLEKLK